MNSVRTFFKLLGRHKMAVATFFVLLLVFPILLFPFSDLADLVSEQVAKASGGQIYLQFSRLGLALLPGPGIELQDVTLDTPFMGHLEATSASVSPSLFSLLSAIPGGSLNLKGFLKGSVEASSHSGSHSENGLDRQRIELHVQKISLVELKDLFDLPVQIKGKLTVESKSQIDFTFSDQPESDLAINIDQLELPAQTLNSAMGPVQIPSLRLSSVLLVGKLVSGQLKIEKGEFGKESDELHGTVTGNLNLTFRKQGVIVPQLGPYDLNVDLSIKSNLEDKLSWLTGMASQFKTSAADGNRYRIRVSAQNVGLPPALNSF